MDPLSLYTHNSKIAISPSLLTIQNSRHRPQTNSQLFSTQSTKSIRKMRVKEVIEDLAPSHRSPNSSPSSSVLISKFKKRTNLQASAIKIVEKNFTSRNQIGQDTYYRTYQDEGPLTLSINTCKSQTSRNFIPQNKSKVGASMISDYLDTTSQSKPETRQRVYKSIEKRRISQISRSPSPAFHHPQTGNIARARAVQYTKPDSPPKYEERSLCDIDADVNIFGDLGVSSTYMSGNSSTIVIPDEQKSLRETPNFYDMKIDANLFKTFQGSCDQLFKTNKFQPVQMVKQKPLAKKQRAKISTTPSVKSYF